MPKIIKCPGCGKLFFASGSPRCADCSKKKPEVPDEILDILKDMLSGKGNK